MQKTRRATGGSQWKRLVWCKTLMLILAAVETGLFPALMLLAPPNHEPCRRARKVCPCCYWSRPCNICI